MMHYLYCGLAKKIPFGKSTKDLPDLWHETSNVSCFSSHNELDLYRQAFMAGFSTDNCMYILSDKGPFEKDDSHEIRSM